MRSLRLFLALAAALSTGCANKTEKEIVIPDAAPVLAALNATQATVLGQSEAVWDATKFIVSVSVGTPQEAEVRDAATKIETSLADIKATLAEHPAAETEKLVAGLLSAIKDLKAILARVQKENAELRDRNAAIWYWLLYGGAVFFTVAAPVTLFYGASLPVVGHLLGPRIAGMFGVLAATLYAMGYAYQWTRAHPFYAGLGFGSVFIAVGLAWANRVRHAETAKN